MKSTSKAADPFWMEDETADVNGLVKRRAVWALFPLIYLETKLFKLW
jgi:hypothetical protein